MRITTSTWILGLGLSSILAAQTANERWTVVLSDPPFTSRTNVTSRTGGGAQMLARHEQVKTQIESRGIRVSSSTTNLLNAFFIHATVAEAAALRTMPGVNRVVPQRKYKPQMAKALELINASAAWARLGGESKAGAGVLIGVIDSGIDPDHPVLKDASLTVPAGYPRCKGADCAYTSNKVIVARSYIGLIAVNSNQSQSRPDDLSPRDHIGHGTAVAAVAAGMRTVGPAGSTAGVAPKAFLANYKVFGTPGVNDDSDPATFDEAVIQAVNDAYTDGVDIAVVALGSPALWGVSDAGAVCGNTAGTPCDPVAATVEAAVQGGMLVVAAAGNDGGSGSYPTYGTINSPAIAPSAIAVGASTNSHFFVSTVYTLGNAPASIQAIDAQLSNGLKFQEPFTAPVLDTGGTACAALPPGSLNGAIALIQRGDCGFFYKLYFAQQAGAIAAIIFQLDGYDGLFPLDGIATSGIPAVLIGSTAGRALQTYIQKAGGQKAGGVKATIDPTLVEGKPDASYQDKVAWFTSWGPTVGDNLLKPEVVAPGTDLYIASQNYDPNGALYHPSKYFAANGTSFSAAMVAGAAALVLQNNRKLTPAQLKSAVVNTANAGIQDYDANGQIYPARILATGAGKLNVGAAVATNVTIEPSTLSFGVITSTLPAQTLKFTNLGTAALTLRLAVQANTGDSRASIAVPVTVSIPAGQSTTVNISLQGRVPNPGHYDGAISITGGAVTLRVPYFYIVGDQIPFNAYALGGDQFVLSAETSMIRLSMKSTDQYGAPIVFQSAAFGSLIDVATVDLATPSTDGTGIAEASVTLGPTLGYQGFYGQVGNAVAYFEGRARLGPQINANGVVNAASGLEAAVAPGSLISINGSGLADASRLADTPYLPWALAGASVSFFSPVRQTSYAGRLVSVSEGLIVVQVPWELAGLAACTMKVSFGYFAQSDIYPVALADASPGVFERADPSGTGTVGWAFDKGGNFVDSSNPVARGATLQILANGLGPVSGAALLTGEVVASPAPVVANGPGVTIGGKAAPVVSATLWTGSAGYYLLTVTVPAGIDGGLQPVVVSAGGMVAKRVSTFVQ